MTPSCSRYGYEAFSRTNPLKAFMITADRLHRCAHDLKYYPSVSTDQGVRFSDPFRDGFDQESFSTQSYWLETDSNLPSLSSRYTRISEWEASVDELAEDERLFYFAKNLEAGGDYDRAVTEYRRLLVFFPNSALYADALVSIFYCYYKGERFLVAVDWGKQLLEEDIPRKIKDEVCFYIAAAYFKVANYSFCRDYISLITPDADLLLEKGYMLKGFSLACEYKWEEAEKTFSSIPSTSIFINESLHSSAVAQEGSNLKLKNPTTAGFLALVPGLGYLYSGHKQTAFSSFIVTSIFFLATKQAFQHDNQGLGTMLSLLSIGWYGGNIYGSVISAHRFNEYAQENLVKRITIGFEF